jgi:hypothetical protein
MLYLRQATASQSVLIGPFIDETDGTTAMTGLTISNTDIRLSANGGNIAAKNSGGGTHDEIGYYTITLDATDTATVGRLQLMVHESGALPVYHEYQVLEEATYDITFAASATGAVPVASIANNAITANSIASDAITSAKIATGAIDADAIADNAIDAGAIASNAITSAKIATGAITAATFAAGAIDAAAIANGAIDAATFAADVDAEILSYIVDDATRIDASALNTATGTTIPAILVDTGTTLDGKLDTISTNVDSILADTGTDGVVVASIATGAITATAIAANAIGASELAADAATEIADAVWATAARTLTAIDEDATTLDLDATIRAAVGLATANLDTQIGDLPTNAELATALGTADDAVLAAVATVDGNVDAIKAKTDGLTFTVTGTVDANITHVNEVEVTGDGQSGTEWGPA